MIYAKSAVFAQIAIAFGLAMITADPGKPGAAAHPQSASPAPRPVHWVKFDADACGALAGVESGHSMLMKSARTQKLGESVDDGGDEDYWIGAWGMSPRASALAEAWILEHPQVAILSDAIAKSCGGDLPDDSDSDGSWIA